MLEIEFNKLATEIYKYLVRDYQESKKLVEKYVSIEVDNAGEDDFDNFEANDDFVINIDNISDWEEKEFIYPI